MTVRREEHWSQKVPRSLLRWESLASVGFVTIKRLMPELGLTWKDGLLVLVALLFYHFVWGAFEWALAVERRLFSIDLGVKPIRLDWESEELLIKQIRHWSDYQQRDV
jgi:hypothetical protein